MRVPFIVYADFESFTPRLSTCQPNPRRATPCSIRNRIFLSEFCYCISCFGDTFYSQQLVTFVKGCNDDDVAKIFIDTLEKNIK